ncbi:SDR family NAD-dependent epimerase/dehydratase [Sporosarcina sp. PTS2304]|uniref:UDP-glucuronic acid decarboxylase family protein n=1 Tax=Sporosarcina sp. PTS2304 TaxID=2283194 RepID=UPI000E0DBFDE|nr:UDP-glucuronic acid decarboxylase family protein [Sporosarcina sp. PTS2304]AXH98425.1 SDR family NAD-dependent epimerase/dehydratase [Sporosarcina sp. PTS2304]
MKQIIVTGGAGFIGSHLIDQLLAQGHYVICIDNFQTGSRRNIAHHMQNQRFKLIEQDIIHPLPTFDHVDEIYNLACAASPVHYQADPIHTFKTNVIGALHVLELATRHHAKVLQASTSEVYGDPLVHPQPESYLGHVNPIGIRSCYDEGKRGAETLFFDYARQYDTKIKVIRIFNTYGPRMDPKDGRVVSNFIMQALQHEPITIYGDGKQSRSFCYVDDLVDGIMKMMYSADDVQGPVNLGNPYEFTMLELAEQVLSKTASESALQFQPLPSDDPKQRQPVIEKANEVLHWQPTIQLDQGLERTIKYFKTTCEKV